MLLKGPVELGEAEEAAGAGGLGDCYVGVDKHGLDIADPGHLDVVGDGEPGDVLKLPGQVIAADIELLRQKLQ